MDKYRKEIIERQIEQLESYIKVLVLNRQKIKCI